jgi:CheY-like chemotaxis protein
MDVRQHIRILLIEDDPADARLLGEAFAEIRLEGCELTTASNGAQALDMLFQRGKYNKYLLPDIILLDIRLPILSGHEVLNVIRANPAFGVIPVIILSTSQDEEDMKKAYMLGAAAYIIKPRAYEDLVGMCRALVGFWFHRVSLVRPQAVA